MPLHHSLHNHLLLTTLLLLSTTATSASNNQIISGSSARLPASLSTVINDLEAEGASRITTTAFLSSHGVTRRSRATLLRTLFGISKPSTDDDEEEADDDEEVVIDGVTTAFGKKMYNDVSGDDSDISDSDEDESVGIAVANPLSDASVSEVAAAVHACGGNIVFVASVSDLNRGEGLFDQLAPAIERILNDDIPAEGEDDAEATPRTLVVVVEGATTQSQLLTAKAQLQSAATEVLSSIVQPGSSQFTTLEEIFDNVEYVSDSSPIDEILVDVAESYDPSTAAANVADANYTGPWSRAGSATLTTPLDLAAARKLLPLSHRTVERCVETVREATAEDGDEDEVRLRTDFGEVVDAAVEDALAGYEEEAPDGLAESIVGKRIRADLEEELASAMEARYVQQLDLYYLASKESFKGALSGLRLSPNLDSDMQDAATKVIAEFSNGVGALRSQNPRARDWPKADGWVGRLKRELKEYVGLRIRTARADGKFKPVPRKGFTVGLHWLLPKPFGNDFRMEPWQVHTEDSLVYIPKDKITDVAEEEVATGDWRNSVVPCPTGKEMIYFK